MDGTPLGQAYDHARNAIAYRDNGSLDAAREAHEMAAACFKQAAQATEDYEAIRIFVMLHEHHKELARSMAGSKETARALEESKSNERNSEPARSTVPTTSDARQDHALSAAHSVTANPALATLAARRAPRDLSSSLASNLATARGKPPSQKKTGPLPPNVTAHHAGGMPAKRGSERASGALRPSIPRTSSVIEASSNRASQTGLASDAFTSFYSSLQGLYSKLPASLAFTGLPLTATEENEIKTKSQEDTKHHKRQGSSRATAGPEYFPLFSAATIKALQQDTHGTFAGQESFYVVPPSSASRSTKGPRADHDGLTVVDDDSDEFVDARENLGPPSPKSSRSSGTLRIGKKHDSSRTTSGKTMEELNLENNALRQLLDTQSRRLQVWETSAQDQSMRLAASRSFGPRDKTVDRTGTTNDESARIRQLDEALSAERAAREALEHQNDKVEREKEKLLAALGKYKDKWALLKESARQRERNKQNKAVNEQGAPD